MNTVTMSRFLRVSAVLLAATLAASSARAQDTDTRWPREIDSPEAKIVIYQPQLESFDDVTLKARSAVSVTRTGKEPVFGAAWFQARVSSDRATGIVTLTDMKVTNARFPNAKADQLTEFKNIVESELPKWDLKLSRDQLVAEMAAVEKQKGYDAKLDNSPPEIIYAKQPTVLVTIDGDPIWQTVEGTQIKSVVNTPFFIAQDPSSHLVYLRGKEAWYSARDVMGPWEAMTKEPPKAVVDLAAKMVSQAPPEEAASEGEPATDSTAAPAEPVVPQVVVRTKPAEVIQTDGEPDFAPIEGTSLLYLKNSEDDVIMDIDSQQYYVLISGRWYASKALDSGAWKYVPGDKLPKDFPEIPTGSDMADVRSSVPGTPEAEEAVMDNQIPQTATVDRKTAKVEVTYDGAPKFEKIEGTSVSYAVNTDKSVLLIGGKYYCCDQAIWFEAHNPSGPWTVCVSVPSAVNDIPPEAPVYNVKYVYVYDYTPEVVYVGYTPAYYGSYVYGGCVVYGTGYYYHPWYVHHYYPRPVTYGFSVHYNPYTGWGFSYGVSYGWFNVRVSTYGGYWGPGGYHYGYNHGYAHGYHHGYSHGYQHGYNNGWAAGYRAGQRAGAQPQPYKRNAYATHTTGVRSTQDRTAYKRPAGATPRRSTRQNNVYADRKGNVYRQTDQGWQKNTKQGWSSVNQPKAKSQHSTKPAAKPSAQPARRPAPAPSKDVNQSYESRQRAQQRSQPQKSKQAPAKRPSGGKRR